MKEEEKTTWLHLPGAREYKPGATAVTGGYGGSIDGAWLMLPVGATVSLHGVKGLWKVVRSHFHWGHPDEESGMHIFVEKA